MKCKKDFNVFTLIGIILAAVTAVAGIAYVVYRFIGRRCLTDHDCCYEYDYDDDFDESDCDDCDCCDNDADEAEEKADDVE